jgi:endonuclease-3 related protein
MTVSPPQVYRILLHHFTRQDWWPVDSQYHKHHHTDPRVEIIIGAILTQNTAWINVEKALQNLKNHQALTIDAIAHMDDDTLKRLIQPSGFFNQKAHRLSLVASHLQKYYNSDLTVFFSRDTLVVRDELLSLHGIGPETADSILLYAGNHRVFVVDAYTRRICRRLPLPVQSNHYDDIQSYFEKNLQKSFPRNKQISVYKEFHALIVSLAKTYCRKTPICDHCPLTLRCEKRV